mgnify:CR=1 FL=1
METVNRNQICREPGEGGSLVRVISMEDHSGVAFLNDRDLRFTTEK